MGHANLWVMEIVGPAILLIVLVWLVMRTRSNRDSDNQRSEQGARDVYAEEEQRRRDGTDQL